jgi:Flp pilus assembly pilin Flp
MVTMATWGVAWLGTLIHDERAQDLAEYGVALAVIGLGAGIAAVAIGANVNTLWTSVNSIIASIAA